MKPAAFDYVKAASVQEALQVLQESQDTKILAGGQSLVPLMNFRLSRPGVIVDVNPLARELGEVRVEGSMLSIGSLVRHQALAENSIVSTSVPVLGQAAQAIGHWAIRNRGTIGGSVAHADPAAELPAVLVALGATVVVRSSQEERRIAADEFFLGYFTTTLGPQEMVTSVELPCASDRIGFYEVVRRPGDFALLGAVSQDQGHEAWVTWFGLGSRPKRLYIDDWSEEHSRRREILAELVDQIELQSEEEYKRTIAVNVALRAFQQAKEGK